MNSAEKNEVKVVSSFVAFPSGYDIINTFSIDYMHGIALGIGEDLIEIGIGRSIPNPPYKTYKLSVQNRDILNKRILHSEFLNIANLQFKHYVFKLDGFKMINFFIQFDNNKFILEKMFYFPFV